MGLLEREVEGAYTFLKLLVENNTVATIKACTGVSTCQVPSCPTAPLAFNAPRPDAVCVCRCAVS